MDELDLVVIGAGIYGLAVAKTYLEVNPSADVMILEDASSVGGVWAEHRLYPGLKSNNLLGTYEFSDFPMTPEIFDIKPGEHVPAQAMHAYLTGFAERFDLISRIQFETRVISAEHKESGGWMIKIRREDEDLNIHTKRLVVATGLTSEAFLPNFKGKEEFDAPLFHCKDFLDYKSTLDTTKRVAVFGGTKSAWDAVYAYASKGVKVDWIIRESGHGPTWMAPPYVTPLKKWLEKLVHTRFFTWLSPCVWGNADGYPGVRKFFHETLIGRFFVNSFWALLGNDVLNLNKYDAHPETKKLKPWIDPIWAGATGLSILNYPTNIFDFVRDGSVKVHIADITGLSEKTVHLQNGDNLPVDALICATGWKHTPPFTFLPSGIESRLGLPHKSPEKPPTDLLSRVDAEIFSRFPRLKSQPKPSATYKPLTSIEGILDKKLPEEGLESYKLYRFIVPPDFLESRDIAFAGAIMTISTTLIAQVQALWISAFLSPSPDISPLSVQSRGEVEYHTLLHARFGRWRSPGGYGSRFPDFLFDAVPYLDLLLQDLGLNPWRKKSKWAEIMDPYGPEDYRGLVREWKDGRRGRKSATRRISGNGNRKMHVE